jgi:hypothetical protein
VFSALQVLRINCLCVSHVATYATSRACLNLPDCRCCCGEVYLRRCEYLERWFSNGAPQEVARCAANIMKGYFKGEKKPICIEIFIHSYKYINIFLILYTKCASSPRTKKVWEIKIIDELEKIWEEAVKAWSRYNHWMCLKRLLNTTETWIKMASVPAEILSEILPNTSTKCYSFSVLLLLSLL